MAIHKTTNDAFSITFDQVEKIVRDISVAYAPIRRSYFRHANEVNALIDREEMNEAIVLMTRVYGLPTGFVKRVGYAAKIKQLAMLNLYGDPLTWDYSHAVLLFRDTKVDLFKLPRYRLIHMIAHEFAHARMHLDKHPHEWSEFATDILALMATGYSEGYTESMVLRVGNLEGQIGYIREELRDEVFRCLAIYADTIYL